MNKKPAFAKKLSSALSPSEMQSADEQTALACIRLLAEQLTGVPRTAKPVIAANAVSLPGLSFSVPFEGERIDALIALHEELRGRLLDRMGRDHDALTRVRPMHAVRRRRDVAWASKS